VDIWLIRTRKNLGWKQIEIAAEEVARRTPFAHCRLIDGVLEADCNQLFGRAVNTMGQLSYE
jgi:tRNA(adenine34) deaminase